MTPTDTVAYSTTTDLVLVYEYRTYVRLLYSKYAYAYGTRRHSPARAATNCPWNCRMAHGQGMGTMGHGHGHWSHAGMDVDRWLSWNKIIIVHR